jgi:hypothetical protein
MESRVVESFKAMALSDEVVRAASPFSLTSLPYDCLLEICSAVAYLDTHYVEDELVIWPISSTSPTLRNLCHLSKSLLGPAQATLFRSAAFETTRQCQHFLRTVKTRPELAKQTLAIQIGILQDQDRGSDETIRGYRALTALMLDAAEHCTSCQHLRIFPLAQPDGMRVLDLVRSLPLRSLALKVYDAHHHLSAGNAIFIYQSLYEVFLNHPLLRTLEHNFRPSVLPPVEDVVPTHIYHPHITAFHITINFPQVFFAVRSFPPVPHLLC